MKKKYFLISLVFALVAFTTPKKAKIIFFGDSITELGIEPGGYIKRLEDIAKQQGKTDAFEFVGAGVSGNKISDLYLRMEDDVLSKNPNLVVIYVGINDVWHKQLGGTGTDAEKFVVFYEAIIKKLEKIGSKVIVCTPSVIGEKNDFSNEQDGDLNSYSNLIKDIAKVHHLPIVDLRTAFVDYEKLNNIKNEESGILTRDSVHPNEKGNQLIAEKMWAVISQINL